MEEKSMFREIGNTKLKLSLSLFLFLSLVFVWSLSIGEQSNKSKQSSAPWFTEEYYMKTGNNFFMNGQYSKAIENYDKALELNPLSYYAAYNIALSLEKLDLIKDAIQAQIKANEIRAKKDCIVIADAIKKFHEDTGTWPFYNDVYTEGYTRVANVDYLYGNMGDLPGFAPGCQASWGSVGTDIYFSLIKNGENDSYPWYKPYDVNSGWNGPYLTYNSEDPWGYKYIVSVSGCEGGTYPDNQVWCISAGPDNYFETPAWSDEVRIDDIGVKVE
jgi:tetratricopeptide (TPR) repeat protein